MNVIAAASWTVAATAASLAPIVMEPNSILVPGTVLVGVIASTWYISRMVAKYQSQHSSFQRRLDLAEQRDRVIVKMLRRVIARVDRLPCDRRCDTSPTDLSVPPPDEC